MGGEGGVGEKVYVHVGGKEGRGREEGGVGGEGRGGEEGGVGGEGRGGEGRREEWEGRGGEGKGGVGGWERRCTCM